jgi:hypothetical protein
LRRHARKWRFWTAILLAGPVIYYVPIVPFAPKCDPFPTERVSIREPMTPEYRDVLTSLFRDHGIVYWHIGDLVLIPILTWATGMGYAEYFEDDLLNAYRRSAKFLAHESRLRSRDGEILGKFGPSFEGKVVAGKVYRVPDHVKALIGRPGAIVDTSRCEVMYAIATGRPASNEMLERWYKRPPSKGF